MEIVDTSDCMTCFVLFHKFIKEVHLCCVMRSLVYFFNLGFMTSRELKTQQLAVSYQTIKFTLLFCRTTVDHKDEIPITVLFVYFLWHWFLEVVCLKNVRHSNQLWLWQEPRKEFDNHLSSSLELDITFPIESITFFWKNSSLFLNTHSFAVQFPICSYNITQPQTGQ